MPKTEQRCPCGACTYDNPYSRKWYVEGYCYPSYCPSCGTRLNPDGTCGQSYEQLERMVEVLAGRLGTTIGNYQCPTAGCYDWDGCIEVQTRQDDRCIDPNECPKEKRTACWKQWAAEQREASDE